MRLQNKVIVVTGSASGIGQAAAISSAQDGAKVAVVDLNQEGIDNTVEAIQNAGGQAQGFCVDIQEEDQVRALFDKIEDAFDHIDGLIHAAGILEGALTPVDNFDELTWDRVIDINLKGSFLVSKYAVPLIEKTEHGVIVLISSVAGVKGGSSSVAYGSSKGGVHGLSLVLASQLAPRNIRVHAVCPGGIETPLKMRVVEKQANATNRSVDQLASGLGNPEGMGKVLSFLVSDDADYMRGTIFTR
ncbi:MAG: SDR family oxidoreductase [Candidatus Latescibacteria bacterium]|jgi:NAD(P)-dependent dehydrogenase (short-subunit alcohol dehydrogenase family)|nr:SDR family oxidoreductase [Candidatus Latescibacterota bacterium]MBT4138707.1 SDR family oxidoreductase [Candidatus Latescibacterota bacterium]MBT5828609.1 SDR family oxidoreductase [Candidatus Latescibacterota bacterium]